MSRAHARWSRLALAGGVCLVACCSTAGGLLFVVVVCCVRVFLRSRSFVLLVMMSFLACWIVGFSVFVFVGVLEFLEVSCLQMCPLRSEAES